MGAKIFPVTLGLVAICLLASITTALENSPTATGPEPIPRALLSPRPGEGAFSFALRQAWQFRKRAWLAANRELEVIETRDPGLTARPAKWMRFRQRMLARDASGDLRRSYTLAREAQVLARTPQEKYRAATLLAGIECERGDHEAELRWAQVLMALEPRNQASLRYLWRAARCNGREPTTAHAYTVPRRLSDTHTTTSR